MRSAGVKERVEDMWKKALGRAAVSAGVAALLSQVSLVITALAAGGPDFVPLVPSYRAHFQSDAVALGVHALLVAAIGAVFGGFSVLFEIERWSLLKQGGLHFLLTAAVWAPISTFLWGLDRYPMALLYTLLSFAVTYGVTWGANYHKYRREIRQINQRLERLRQEKGED